VTGSAVWAMQLPGLRWLDCPSGSAAVAPCRAPITSSRTRYMQFGPAPAHLIDPTMAGSRTQNSYGWGHQPLKRSYGTNGSIARMALKRHSRGGGPRKKKFLNGLG